MGIFNQIVQVQQHLGGTLTDSLLRLIDSGLNTQFESNPHLKDGLPAPKQIITEAQMTEYQETAILQPDLSGIIFRAW